MKRPGFKVTQKAVFLLIIFLIMTVGAGTSVTGIVTDELKINDTNVKVKAVEPGEDARYEWLLTNEGRTNCTVRVILSEIGKQWSIEIESGNPFTLTPGNSSKVSIAATPNSEDADDEVDVIVIFIVTSEEGTFDVQRAVKVEKIHDPLIFDRRS